MLHVSPCPLQATTMETHKSPYVQPTLEGATTSSLSTTRMYALSVGCAVGGSLAALLALSYLVCPLDVGLPVVDQLCTDTHYKYLVPLLVPVTAWFAIANWVGWQYFRHA
ncbi:uncharacterized protein LOC62_03G004600 [Vanrija pseudolonga]|uniref:Transmembrane protein n=1 Tax=Vanrija pseudolonga TaxID=143232 RepID=A0AAF1BI23_9TREE|nr:hypothetical protein LOC62_03G004600 [Vanrija pseudolonga]